MKIMTTIVALASLIVLSACVQDSGSPGQSSVGTSSDLSSFVGARAGQAEMGIQNLGYELIRTDGLTGYWFNRQSGSCAAITTADGRYSSINMLPAEDC